MSASVPARGFSLIELMIVVAIIAILAALALPRYQSYVGRAQAAEAMSLLDALKTPVQEYAAEHAACPRNGDGGIAAEERLGGRYVAGIAAAGNYPDCALTATFKDTGLNAALAAQSITLAGHLGAEDENGNIQWDCSSSIDPAYLPSQCAPPAN